MNIRTIEKNQIVKENQIRKRQEKIKARIAEKHRRKSAAKQRRMYEQQMESINNTYERTLMKEYRATQRSGRSNFNKNKFKKR